MDLSLSGDLLSAGSALSGLVLVFLGGVLNTYAGFDTEQQPAVRTKYRRKAWACFAGFALSLAGTVFAFLANAWNSVQCLKWSAATLGAALFVLLVMAVVEVMDI
jgi:hypothetical protein